MSVAEASASTLEEIDRRECFILVASMSIGRIAVALPGGPPIVVPVNYALDGEVVVFRTGPGTKLDLLREHPVSFQVDLIDAFHHTGWSVLIHGVADTAEETGDETVCPQPWAGGDKRHWVRVVPETITGRRIKLPPAPFDNRGYL